MLVSRQTHSLQAYLWLICGPGLAPSVDADGCQPLEGACNYPWGDTFTHFLPATFFPGNLLANWRPQNTPVGVPNSCDCKRKVKCHTELN